MVGKHVLIGLTYLNDDFKVDHQEQHHGSLLQADLKDGVEIWENDSTKILTLPPDLRVWERARRGIYTLRSTGEEVTNLDYISTWLYLPYRKEPIPSGKRFERPKSSTFSFYGFGTMYWGSRKCTDKSAVITTKWITALFLPLWPLGSFMVWKQGQTVSFGLGLTGEHYSQPVFLDKRQVLLVYLIALPLLALFLFACLER